MNLILKAAAFARQAHNGQRRKTITSILAIAAVSNLIGTEILRSVIHDSVRKKTDLVALKTQDIAMWGTMIGWLLLVATGVSGLLWLFAI